MILINKSILYTLIIVTALFSATSCSFNEFPDSTKIVDISEEIELRLLPQLDDDSKLQWFVSTKENKYCAEALLQTQVIDNPSRYELLIQGIETPEDCESSNEKINSVESFNKTENAIFKITFSNELSSNISILKLNNTYKLEHIEQIYFTFSQSELKPFDKVTFWAGVKNENVEDFAKVYFALDEFAKKHISNKTPDGDYGYVNKLVGNQIVLNPITLESFENSYSFQISNEVDYSSLLSELEVTVENFKLLHPNIDFFVATSEGDLL